VQFLRTNSIRFDTIALLSVALFVAAGFAPGQESPPATAEQPAAPQLAPQVPAESPFHRLLKPEIAAQCNLTDQQRTEIERIFNERDGALTQAPAEDRAAVIADADRQIAQLLTEDQRNRIATLDRDEKRRLKFSFRFQPWADVLNWFAEQADLSLVLDAPPPGTFNYSDTREYTVAEAIDQLNRVLLTKGYTLLRGERMLMLIDLQNGLPIDLIPHITPAELPSRGKYEIVSIAYPIGDRNAEEVKAEIQPLIGTHGQISVLPKTKQLLVTDTAGKMAAIEAVITKIPEPKREGPRNAGEAPKPELAVFPLGGLDAKAAIDILSALFPDVKLVHDAKANQLMAHAPPEKKTAIEGVLARIRDDASDTAPRLERHPLRRSRSDRGDRSETYTMFRAVAPDAVFRYDFESNELIVWAPPEQQAKIREMIEQLGQAGSPAEQRQLEVYRVHQSDPAALVTVLERMLPDVRFAVDTATRSIVALAGPTEQQTIKSTIEQLEHQEDDQTLKVYSLTPQQRKRVQAALTSLAKELPGMQVVPDDASGDLSVWATAEQHARIAGVVEQVNLAKPATDQFEVATYPISAADVSSVLTVLQTLLPEVKFVADAKAKQIVAWAAPADQETIRRTIEQLDADHADEKRPQLMSHPIADAAPDTLITMLRTILPDVQVVNDAKNLALVAWARPSEHEVIRRAIEQAQPNTPDEKRSRVEVYPVADADPLQVAAMLTTIFPTSRFTGDRAAAKLIAWATPAEHESIKTTIAGMVKSELPGRELKPVVYRPKSADVSYLLYDLRTLVPEARLAADAKNGVIVAWATPADQEKIRSTIEGLDAETSAEGRKVAVYHARDTDAATLLTVLQSAVPDGRYTADTRNGSVIAFARPEQHETLRQAVEQMVQTEGLENKRTAKVYRFRAADATAAYQVLRYLVPYAYLAIDTRTGSLAATATPAEHDQIAALVDQMEGHGAAEGDLELQVYEIHSAEPANVYAMLRDLFAQRPEVRFSIDSNSGKLAAWALPSQHKMIREVVERVDSGRDGLDDRQIEVYPLGDANPESVARTLSTMFQRDRNVRIVPDDNGGFVTVWGDAQVQASAKAVIEQMQGHKENVAVIPLDVVDPYTAQGTIERLFGDRRGRDRAGVPRVDIDPDGRQLLVRASKEQLQQIRNMLTEMGEPKVDVGAAKATSDRRTRVIPISDRNLRAALEEIGRIWPSLRDNPIRIVTPSAVAPTVREDRNRRESQPEASATTLPEEAPANLGERHGPLAETEPSAADEPAPPEEPSPNVPPSAGAPSAPPEPGASQRPAIVIAPSGDSITISSDDPEALDQFEQLLKSFVKRSSAGGREFAIFYLKRATATTVADTVQNVVLGGGFGFRGYSGATIVPDQRLNAVIVQASRNEMELIDSLIQTLDTEEVPASAIGQKPKLIPVKNTDAERIAEILREVYKTRLTSGGARQPLPRSERMPREMAALMQQLNAATTGPEMSLGVDSATNSLVVSAPPQLLAEIEQLVQTLDDQSNASKPTVRVMALKQVNTQALGRVLDNLIRENSSGRRRRSQ
jgi:type II secretory pathway component GspD/PulD (secretin)